MKSKITSKYAAAFVALLLIACSTGCNRVNDDLIVESNNIRNYLVNAAGEITASSTGNLRSAAEWEKVRSDRYREFIEMLSMQDMPAGNERNDLNVTVTGKIQRDGYHIEKLYYESLPGLFVPANLYVPGGIKEPAPAIIYLCGHSHTQKVHYQAHPAKLARMGFVCLIVETIQYGEVRGQHHGCYARGWFNWYSRGYTPGGVEVWNAIRGLDLLAGRAEVDSERLGATGISGGGAISWFLAAADHRVKAAAPVCGASTVQAQISTRTVDGHCDCMMPVNTYRIDFQSIGALIAPRPLLIAQADRDGLNRVESVRQIYNDLKGFYRLQGVPQNIEYVETPGGHSYHKLSREKIFSFFAEHLMGRKIAPSDAGDIDTSPASLLSEDELRVYSDGIPAGDRTTTIQDSFVKLAAAPVIEDEKELAAYRDSVKSFLIRKTFGAFPETPPAFDPVHLFRTLDRSAYGSDIYSFLSEKGWRLKVDIRWRNDTSLNKPLMIVVRNPEEQRRDSEVFAGRISNDWNIAYLEVRGVGENGWAPDLQWHIRRAAAWTGRTIASMQVYDLLRCIEFCRTLKGVNPDSVGIAARDEMGAVALYSALLDGRCKTIILKNPPSTQDTASSPDGRSPAIEMLNCLRITDVGFIPTLVAPAEMIFIGDVPESYKWSENTLAKVGMKSFTRVGSQ